MKKLIIVLFILIVFVSCKKAVNESKVVVTETQKEEVILDRSSDFPEDIAAVFKAHGGIQAFDQQQTLVFEIIKPNGNEKHSTDLKTRHARIETDKYTLGFDGKDAWIKQDSTYFDKDPRFYHNLMFYFYAMPFVLGDDGITYEKAENLIVGETTYPGYKITYSDGVGDSPKDNYFLYYDSTTYKMKYLGYTVTFFNKEVSDKVSLIEYADWNMVNGLLLPKTLKWRQYKDAVVGEIKNEVNFVNAAVSKDKMDAIFYKKHIE